MRSIFFVILCAVALLAQTTPTVVTGTIVAATGALLTGSCSIQAVTPWDAAGGERVVGPPVQVKFTSGKFSVSLIPTSSATPSGQYYKVTCSAPTQTVNGVQVGALSWGPLKWIVPAGPPVTIGDVEVSTEPTPSMMILLQQIDVSAFPDGCVKVLTHQMIVDPACTGAGGGGPQSWQGITSTIWAGITSSIWGGIVP